MVKESRLAYGETVERLSTAIARAGNTIFATIDQSAAASSAGLTLRPTTLIIFGNPKAGTPLMGAVPLVALDLPLKLLIWEQEGSVRVAFTPMIEIAARYAVTGMDALVEKIDKGLDALTDSVTS